MSGMHTIEEFTKGLNSAFTVEGYRDPVEMELIEVEDTTEKYGPNAPLKKTPFSMIFRAPKGTENPQGNYYVTHEESVGKVALFMVPIGPEEKEKPEDSPMLYQVVVN
ncbi:MAG: hypothetical protein OEZ04_04940 [Nitrospinota bacterium]|nr:hypothetical protein [Nitrospinota bacterium]